MIDLLNDSLDTVQCVMDELQEVQEYLENVIDEVIHEEESCGEPIEDLYGSVEFIKNEIDVLFLKLKKGL